MILREQIGFYSVLEEGNVLLLLYYRTYFLKPAISVTILSSSSTWRKKNEFKREHCYIYSIIHHNKMLLNSKSSSLPTCQFIDDVYLIMVPLKELQEAGLGACGALNPPETQIIAGSLQVPHVHGQVLQPQTRSLSYRGQLGRPVGRAGGEGKYVNTAMFF